MNKKKPLLSLAVFLCAFVIFGLGVSPKVLARSGPPIDMSGDWEAVPALFGYPSATAGPYHRLSVRLTNIDPIPQPDGRTVFTMTYTGTLTYYTSYYLYSGCEFNGPRTFHNEGYRYNVTINTSWGAAAGSQELRMNSFEGTGLIDPEQSRSAITR